MKTASTSLLTLLNNNVDFIMGDLVTFNLIGGVTLRYAATDDLPITSGGYTYTPIHLDRNTIKTVKGLEVDSLEITISPKIYPITTSIESEQDMIGGVPWLKAARLGALDGASVTLERAFFSSIPYTSVPSTLTPVGTVIMFTGNVAEPVELTYEAKITIKSDIEIFNRQFPRNLYQPGCQYTLFDSGCSLNKSSWATISSVGTGSSISVVKCGITSATGYYDLGVVEFTDGVLDGISKTIKSQVPGEVILSSSLTTIPEIGVGLILWPGCDKQQTTCMAKFSNLTYTALNTLSHFRGFPDVPKPESSY